MALRRARTYSITDVDIFWRRRLSRFVATSLVPDGDWPGAAASSQRALNPRVVRKGKRRAGAARRHVSASEAASLAVAAVGHWAVTGRVGLPWRGPALRQSYHTPNHRQRCAGVLGCRKIYTSEKICFSRNPIYRLRMLQI